MIPVGQVYRPSAGVDARSVLSATILGVVTAVSAALMVWLWELSPIPTLVIITALIQGCLIGLVLMFVIGRLRLRHPALLMIIGLACGLTSVALVHYGHYLHFLDQVGDQYKAFVARADNLSPEQKQEMLAKLNNGSGVMADAFLADKTGHGGFLGSLIFRTQVGLTIKNARLAGTGVWILWGIEAVAVALVASLMAGARGAMPFCEDCGNWCSLKPAPVQLEGKSATPFAEAVRINDLATATELLKLPVHPEAIQWHGTKVGLHSCDECDQTFADVDSYVVKLKKKKPETTTTSILKRVRISPEMTALLREPPVAPSTEVAGANATRRHFEEPATLVMPKSWT